MNPQELNALQYLAPGIASSAVSLAIVLTKRWHGRHTLDTHEGVQKFHNAPTSRIGGLALYIGIIIAWALLPGAASRLLGFMLIAGIPAFAAGFIEDLTKRVGVRERLLATMLSGAAAWYLTGYSLTRIDVEGIDMLLSMLPVSVAFTAFAVGGVANSVNIIDGFNGLAGGVLIICFALLGMLAWQAGDLVLVDLAILFSFCVAGFMLINFPYGKIFMGDGGAYFMGYLLAWTSLMLPMRNPGISPWAPIVICAYPIIETLFSMIRRARVHAAPGQPDSEHLHSLIKLRVIRPHFSQLPHYVRNAMVSPFSWALALIMAFPALMYPGSTPLLQLTALGSFIAYGALYRGLKNMETPPNAVHSYLHKKRG